MVKCVVPVKLYGPLAGEYERDKVYPDDELATLHPDCFEVIPTPGQEGPRAKSRRREE